MENSSKALIIAGSILISILLISIGLVFFTSASGMVDQANSNSKSMAISAFNTKFTKYFGSSVSGSQAKDFVTAVINNNSMPNNNKIVINFKYKDKNGKDKYVQKINNNGKKMNMYHMEKTESLQQILNKISISSNYEIKLTKGCNLNTDGYNNGYIRCVTILHLN